MENPAKLSAAYDLFGSRRAVPNILEEQGDGRMMTEQDNVQVKLVIAHKDDCSFRVDVLMVPGMIWNVMAHTYHHNLLALVMRISPPLVPSMRVRQSQIVIFHLANSMPHIHNKAIYSSPEFQHFKLIMSFALKHNLTDAALQDLYTSFPLPTYV